MDQRSTTEDQTDPLDNLLNLEDEYHREGYSLGVADGSRSGRIEGRIFGLEKGLEKFLEMGRLQGRTAVWRADSTGQSSASTFTTQRNERLNKHISRLHELTDVETLSTENSEDAVSDFDDRLKDAKAKATLVSKILGEDDTMSSLTETSAQSPKQVLRTKDGTEKKANEMEDFAGLPRGKAPRDLT